MKLLFELYMELTKMIALRPTSNPHIAPDFGRGFWVKNQSMIDSKHGWPKEYTFSAGVLTNTVVSESKWVQSSLAFLGEAKRCVEKVTCKVLSSSVFIISASCLLPLLLPTEKKTRESTRLFIIKIERFVEKYSGI